MCGIAGLVDIDASTSQDRLIDLADRMTSPLTHRGPDGSGVWADAHSGVAFGHRRLAIIDLSEHGSQPMTSASGRYVLTYNGELYNMTELRRELASTGCRFRGHSDTEVLLSSIDAWGLPGALSRFDGMFAFALWDRSLKQLHLARDRIGEKPLYYGWAGRSFVFGSELKSLMAHPDLVRSVDRNSLALFLRYGYVPSPYSLLHGTRKLPPATTLTVGPSTTPESFSDPHEYWSLSEVAQRVASRPESAENPATYADELHELLGSSVERRLQADVPVGAFLSGGIDSTLITSLMCERSTGTVRTFTIGFAEASHDESAHALQVARHLGTDHTTMTVGAADALAVIPQLPRMYDEPFADSSQIPTFLLSRLTRQHVTVSLSGDGGDEFFGGYNRYAWCPRVWRLARPIPLPIRAAVGRVSARVRPATWDASLARLGNLLPETLRVRTPVSKLQKLAALLPERDIDGMFRRLTYQWSDPTSVVLNSKDVPTRLTEEGLWPSFREPASRFMYLDAMSYLPDDILVKVDRASMFVALEARVPFLDHRVVEFAVSLPLTEKLRGDRGKVILRQLLSRYVPTELVDRPKMGFALPVGEWLRGGLRVWAEGLLDSHRLETEGYFSPAAVTRAWNDHVTGRHDRESELWCVLMFQAWLDEWGKSGSSVGRRFGGSPALTTPPESPHD
jgi:asparagine synthase (glutamine-hydrolysing)